MPLVAEPPGSFVVMAAMVSVRLLVCSSESGFSLSQPGSLLIAMAGGEVGAVQKVRVMASTHRHQRDLGQPAVAVFRTTPELETQRE